MKIINDEDLPAEIILALETDSYSRGDSDISVTQLVNPPQMEALKHFHAGELTQNASDMIWSLIGQSIHSILERTEREGDKTEERLYMDVHGWTVSGQFDRWSAGTLRDYKVTSVYAGKDLINGGKPEWATQLNFLAVLCKANDIDVDDLEVFAIFRDWSKFGRRRDPDYPPSCMTVPIPMLQNAESLLKDRVIAHQNARQGLYEPCTADEMWERPTTYAVMKEGRKSALRVLDSEDSAQDWIDSNQPKGKISIEKRPGERVRCENYCPVRDYCTQYAEYHG